jgi:hypothetical protein
MGSNNPSGNERDQFSPETGDKIVPRVEISINVSFDFLIEVPENYTKDMLVLGGQLFRHRYKIKEQVANVEENI